MRPPEVDDALARMREAAAALDRLRGAERMRVEAGLEALRGAIAALEGADGDGRRANAQALP